MNILYIPFCLSLLFNGGEKNNNVNTNISLYPRIVFLVNLYNSDVLGIRPEYTGYKNRIAKIYNYPIINKVNYKRRKLAHFVKDWAFYRSYDDISLSSFDFYSDISPVLRYLFIGEFNVGDIRLHYPIKDNAPKVIGLRYKWKI